MLARPAPPCAQLSPAALDFQVAAPRTAAMLSSAPLCSWHPMLARRLAPRLNAAELQAEMLDVEMDRWGGVCSQALCRWRQSVIF